MKKITTILLIMPAHQAVVSAQCGVNYRKILEKYCKGKYLVHQEMDNKSGASATLILEEENKYAVYLLNPSHSIPSLTLEGRNNIPFKDFETKYDQKENYSVTIFTIKETGEYYISLDFGTQGKACVLMAIYLQNDTLYKAGIYKSLKEFAENKPSIDFNYQIITRLRGYGVFNSSGRIPFYRLNTGGGKLESIGRVFGFCDGKNVYINEDYPKLGPKAEFVRAENMGRYLYFEDRGSQIIFIWNVPSTSFYLEQKIMDIKTGEVISLTRKTLQAIIADDSALLLEFKSDTKKNKNLKEYLIRYLGKQRHDSLRN